MGPAGSRSGARIIGWGAALPEKVLTNDELAATLDTNDAWITERTGIRSRHIGGTTSGLAIEAATRAMESANCTADDIDLVVLATTTPDDIVPATACAVQDALGITGGAFDVNAACSGFVYALVAASGMLGLGAKRALVIGAETMSRITDYTDRTLAILSADGAGAVVLEATNGPSALLGWDLGSDGSARKLLYCEWGAYMKMQGRELFRRAVKAMVGSAVAALQRAGLKPKDVDVIIPHQANIRIIEAACERLGVSMDRAVITIDHTGNTSSASIPLALNEAVSQGRLTEGDQVLLTGFGAGMTWASVVLRWMR